MSIPRICLFLIVGYLVLPWLLVEGSEQLSVASSGQFEPQISKNTYAAAPRELTYQAPNVGVRHDVQVKRFGYIGDTVQRTYYSLGATSGEPRPAIVLLHGAGRDGRAMIDMWKELAQAEDIVLIAPDATRALGWSLAEDTTFVVAGLLDHAKATHPINPNRIYLVGHSMGGKMAVRLANLGLGPWKAVSVHAASVWPSTIWPARKPIPIQFYVGEFDDTYTPENVRATGQRLSEAGHDVKVTLIPRHTHWYYAIAPFLARAIWKEFEAI